MAGRLLQAHLSKEHHSHLMVTVLEVRGLHPRKGEFAADPGFPVATEYTVNSLMESIPCLANAPSFAGEQLLHQICWLWPPWSVHPKKPIQI